MDNLGFIHRYLPAGTREGRVLLLLHGTGGDENDLVPLGRQLDPEAALLSPRGNVSENGMPRFFRRFAEGVFDEEDVIRRAGELADFIGVAAAAYGFDAQRITAVGYSNGANIAAAMLLLRPDVLSAAVLFRAMVTLSNPPRADLSGKRILISAGASDPVIPLQNAQALAATLQLGGADVRFDVQPAGHALVQQDIVTATRWLAG